MHKSSYDILVLSHKHNSFLLLFYMAEGPNIYQRFYLGYFALFHFLQTKILF